ncbi:MAG TPA: DUF4097 family beta strand repeat-containing protein [Candidatus Babeliaceae bacterium]|nr:DUF4097 family beta strand repeat-containing protein [Candidatus Babeliaceae bacterium]
MVIKQVNACSLIIRASYIFFYIYSCPLWGSFFKSDTITSWFKATNEERLAQEYPLASQAIVELHGLQGDITVKAWNKKKIMVEAIKYGSSAACSNTHISITPENNHITITSSYVDKLGPTAYINYTVLVPQRCNLRLYNGKGNTTIYDIHGTIFSQTERGDTNVHDATESVTVKNSQGSIHLDQKKFTDEDSIFLETGKGSIYLSIHRSINANLHAKTRLGTVTSEIPITTFSQTVKLNKETWNNWKRSVKGALGQGGAPITIDVTKGNIVIKEY